TPSMAPTIEPRDRLLVNKLLRPRRWDMVAYWRHDEQPPAVYCKRLIALPGERLRFDGGMVYINDQLMPAPAVVAGRCHASVPGTAARYADGQTIALGSDEYFLVGDNVD